MRCFRRFLKFEDRARVFALTKMAALRLGARLASGVARVFARGCNLVFSAGNLWRERESLVSSAEVARPSFIELSARFLCGHCFRRFLKFEDRARFRAYKNFTEILAKAARRFLRAQTCLRPANLSRAEYPPAGRCDGGGLDLQYICRLCAFAGFFCLRAGIFNGGLARGERSDCRSFFASKKPISLLKIRCEFCFIWEGGGRTTNGNGEKMGEQKNISKS